MCQKFAEFNVYLFNAGDDEKIETELAKLEELYSGLPYPPPEEEIQEIHNKYKKTEHKSVTMIDVLEVDSFNPTDRNGDGMYVNTNVVFKNGTCIITLDDYETVKEKIFIALDYDIEYTGEQGNDHE